MMSCLTLNPCCLCCRQPRIWKHDAGFTIICDPCDSKELPFEDRFDNYSARTWPWTEFEDAKEEWNESNPKSK